MPNALFVGLLLAAVAAVSIAITAPISGMLEDCNHFGGRLHIFSGPTYGWNANGDMQMKWAPSKLCIHPDGRILRLY